MGIQKALISFVAAAILLLSNIGIELPENVLGIVNAVTPVLGTALVWFIPNSTST